MEPHDEGPATEPRARSRVAGAAKVLWVLLTLAALVLAVVAIVDRGEPGPRGPRGVVGATGAPGLPGPPVSEDDDVITDLQSQLDDANDTIDCLNDNIQRLEQWTNSLSTQESVFRVYLNRC